MQILKALPVVAALAVAFGLGACGNKANLEVTGDDGVAVSVAPFDKVELSGSGVMTFAQKPGPQNALGGILRRVKDWLQGQPAHRDERQAWALPHRGMTQSRMESPALG